MKIKKFENIFFQMLSLFHENTSQISYSYKSHSYFGKEIFKSFLDRMLKNLDDAIRNRFYRRDDVPNDENYESFRIEEINKVSKADCILLFEINLELYEDDLNAYFTTLYNILKLIDKAEEIDKLYYASIINSQFTKLEKLTIFYFVLSEESNSGFRQLVEKFNLLDGVKEHMVINKKIFEEYKPNLNNKLLLI